MLVLLLTVIKMFGRLFRFEYGFVHTDFVELFTVHLLEKKSRCYHFLKPRYMQNKKSSKHDHQAGKQHCHVAFHFEYGRKIRTSQQKFVYTILVELFTTHLLKEKSKCYDLSSPNVRSKKSFKHCTTVGHSTAMQIVHFEYRRNIRTSQQKFVYTILVELFTVNLLKETPRFYHFVKPRYMRNKKCLNIFVTPGILHETG